MNTQIEPQQPIVSLSLNPAIDLTYEITDLKHDQKSRSLATCYDPGGTGINVGRALEKLKANSHTCCFTAGKMGEFLESMLKQELSKLSTIQVEGETRINTTILQHSPKRQYEINATGPTINNHQLDNIICIFLRYCRQGIGILTGSLPPGLPDDTYCNINMQIQKQGGRCIIDAPVEALKKALASKPFMIKPNLHELETLRNKHLKGIEQIASEARLIIEEGTSNVCVSLGDKGAILIDSNNSYYCNSPDISIHSTVGSGDSLVAGLAYSFAQNHNPEQALKFAVACGTGTAKQTGTQLFDIDDVKAFLNRIQVITLNI